MKLRSMKTKFSTLMMLMVAGMIYNFNPLLKGKASPGIKEWKPKFASSELDHVRWLRANVSKKASEQEVRRLRKVYLEARDM